MDLLSTVRFLCLLRCCVGGVGVGVEPGGARGLVGVGTLLGSGESRPGACPPGTAAFFVGWVARVGLEFVNWIVDASIL